MAGLQRSSVSFRRQGSSGLVWEDRFLSGELNHQTKKKEDEEEAEAEGLELRTCKSVGSMERSRSGGGRTWRTGKVSPAIDPPSPKVFGCGLCGVFGRPISAKHPKSRKR